MVNLRELREDAELEVILEGSNRNALYELTRKKKGSACGFIARPDGLRRTGNYTITSLGMQRITNLYLQN